MIATAGSPTPPSLQSRHAAGLEWDIAISRYTYHLIDMMEFRLADSLHYYVHVFSLARRSLGASVIPFHTPTWLP